ncbi:hypothetical protein TNCV_695421 [Trichonephila clavipes]|nr:hypothetical protein TNCV_695421 [Trichonephila clavipes]
MSGEDYTPDTKCADSLTCDDASVRWIVNWSSVLHRYIKLAVLIVLRGGWSQWIREMSFTRKRGSGRPRQTSCREDCHIVRNARVQQIASSVTLEAQEAPSLGIHVSSRII